MIYYMVQRLRQIKEIDNIIICTSKTKQDSQIVKFCKKHEVDYYCGSSKDVILRLKNAAEYFSAKYIVNIPADNPIVDPIYIKKTILLLKQNKYDLIRNYSISIGLFCYGMTFNSLKKVCDIKKSNSTEVWYKYYSETGFFKIYDIKPLKKHSKLKVRLTVDYKEDFLLIKKLILYFLKNLNFNINHLIRYFEKFPKDLNINKNLNQKTNKRYLQQSVIKLRKNIKFRKYKTKYYDYLDYKN